MKQLVRMSRSTELVAFFKSSGAGRQSRMDDALTQTVGFQSQQGQASHPECSLTTRDRSLVSPAGVFRCGEGAEPVFVEALAPEVAYRAETDLSPTNGARVMARAWLDAALRDRLLADATSAAKEMGIEGFEGHQMVAVAHTQTAHNALV